MKSNYTYEDVMKKAAAYGLLADMSDADRNLTMRNPDAGMTTIGMPPPTMPGLWLICGRKMPESNTAAIPAV